MKAWTRFVALSLLVFAGSMLSLRAAEDPPAPANVSLTLYRINGAQTGKPAIDEAIKFLKNILAAFPQFDTFKLLDSPSLTLVQGAPQTFTTGDFTTTVTLNGFTLGADAAKNKVWKAEIKIECQLGKVVIHNLTVRMTPGEQHTWNREAMIFVLQEPAPK